jgi:ribosome-associated protein
VNKTINGMKPEELIARNFENEFVYSASRSSGPGGQNINKVNTKVELRFSITNSLLLSDDEKELISRKLKNKMNKDGELILSAQSERTQLKNKTLVTRKFFLVVSKALTAQKTRRSTSPSISSINKRLEEKHQKGNKKNLRRQSGDSDE